MQIKSIAECSKILVLSTFIELQFVIKIFKLSFLSGRFRQVLLYQTSKRANNTDFADTQSGLFIGSENPLRGGSCFTALGWSF